MESLGGGVTGSFEPAIDGLAAVGEGEGFDFCAGAFFRANTVACFLEWLPGACWLA